MILNRIIVLNRFQTKRANKPLENKVKIIQKENPFSLHPFYIDLIYGFLYFTCISRHWYLYYASMDAITYVNI